ncbi:MAG: periplasmic heavy metal sensor [Magnetococcales bacterium]|nr:periplasmic heavy metal sensor [Magnetococcales bacterium]
MMPDMQRTLLIILSVSVAVNFFLGGLLFKLKPGNESGKAMTSTSGGSLMMGIGMMRTEVAQNPEVIEIWNRREAAVHSAMADLYVAQEKVHNALTAEPWSKLALTESLAELRRNTTVCQEVWHQALVEVVAVLPLEQRKRGQLALTRGHGMGRGMGRGMGMGSHTDHPTP